MNILDWSSHFEGKSSSRPNHDAICLMSANMRDRVKHQHALQQMKEAAALPQPLHSFQET
jgi:hypothetical protein